MSARPVFAALRAVLVLVALAAPALAAPPTGVSVVPVSLGAGEVTTHSINFTPSDLDRTESITVTFPVGFDLTGSIAAVTTTMGGSTLSVSVAGQVVTVTRDNSGTQNINTATGFTLSNIRNANLGSYVVTVSTTDDTPAAGAPAFTIVVGATHHLAVSGITDPIGAGVASGVTVTAQDFFNNTTPAYTGTITFTSSDGAATLPANYAFVGGDAGVRSFPGGVTLVTTGVQSVTATDTVTASITGSQANIDVTPGPAQTLSVTGITDPVGAGTASGVTVTARDQFNNVATGYTGTITFSSTDGAATLPANYAFVAGDMGVRSFPGGVTLRTAGVQSVTATDTVTGTITGTQANIDVTPGLAQTLSVTGITDPVTAGTASGVTVTARDQFNNVATGYTGTITFSSTDGAATLPANYAFVAGDMGVRSFPGGVTLRTAGVRSVTATDTVTGTITGTQANIDVNPAATSQLLVTGILDPITAGAADNFTVTAADQFGNTTPTYVGTVTFSSTDGAATLPADTTFVLGDAGVRTFSVTLRTAGVRSVTATDTVMGAITGTQANIDVVAAAAQTLQVTGIADPITAGVNDNFTVTARDAFNNVATGYTGTVAFTSTDPQAQLPANTTFVAGDMGTRTFSLQLRTVGVQSVTATDTVTATITGTQANIDVNPAGAATLSVTGITDPVTAGTASGVTVTARDQFNNVATGYTGTITFSSTDGAATLPANYAFVAGDMGVRSFPGGVTLRTAGVRSVTATDTVTGTITGTQANIDVNPAATSQLLVTGILDPITAGVADNFTVTAADQFGNTTPTYVGTVAFSSTDPSATLPANTTFVLADAGVRTFSVTLRTVGSRSVTATDTVMGAITGTQANIDVVAAAAQTLEVAGILDPITAGVADNFTVTARDAFNNVATGYTGTVTFSSTDPQAVLPANTTFVAGDMGVRTFSVTLRTAGVRSVTATDTVTPAITGTQANIDVNPAATSQLLVAGVTDPVVAGTASGVTVTARDAFGNTTPAYTGTITFTSNDGAATLPANYTFVGGDAGVRSFPGGVILRTAGVRTVTATDTVMGAITGTQNNIDVTPGPATTLVVAGISDPIAAGTNDNFTVTARDAFNNTATGYTGTVTFTSTDPQAQLPANTTYVAGDMGVRTFTVQLRTAGVHSVTATDTVTATITGTQASIDVTPGTAAQLVFTSQPTGTGTNTNIPGTPGPGIQVTAQDAFGNTVTGFTENVTITKASGPGALSGTNTQAAVAGVATFLDLQLNQDGDYTLGADDAGGGANPAAAVSNTFTIGVFRWSGNALNGNWQDAGNWTPGLPGAADRVVFDATTSPNAAGSPPTNNTPANLGALEINANYTANVTLDGNLTLAREVLVSASANPGTLQLGGFSLSVGGNGTFGRSPANGTINFTATFTATPTLTLAAAVTFPTLRVSGGTVSLQNATALGVGTLQVDNGAALDTNTAFDPAVNVTVSTVLNGALLGNNSALSLANLNQGATGNLTLTGPGSLGLTGNAVLAGAGTISGAIVTANANFSSVGAGAFNFSGASELRLAGAGASLATSANDMLQTLRVQAGATQAMGSSTLDINGNLIIDGGTFSLLAGAGADIEGTVTINAGAWNLNGAQANVGGGTDATVSTAGGPVQDTAGTGTLVLEAAGGGNPVGGASNVTVGNLTVAQGRANLASALTTVLQTTTVAAGAILGGPAATLDTVNLTLVGNGAYAEGTGLTQVSGTLTLSGTSTWVDDTTGELQLDGAGQTWDGGDRSVGNVRANGAGVTLMNSAARVTTLIVAAGNTFSVGDQTLTLVGTTNPPLSVAGNLLGTTGGVTYAPAVPTALSLATGANVAYPDLTLTNAGQVFSAAGPLNVGRVLDVTAGSLSLGAGVVLTLSGSGTPFTANGTLLMAANATVAYTGGGPVTMRQGTYPGNVTVGGAAAGAFASGTSVVNGVLTVNNTATLTVVDLSLAGTGTPLIVAGGITTGSGVVRYTGANAVVAATTFPNLTLQNGAFTQAGAAIVALDLTVTTPASLTPGANQLTAQRALGTGTLDLLNSTLRLTGSANPLQVSTLQNLLSSTIDYAGNSAQVRSADAPNFTYGNLTLSGGGTATLTAGSAMYVGGNLSFQVNSTFAGTVQFEPGSVAATFACGSSVVSLGGLVLNKAASTHTVQLTGADFVLRTIGTLTLTRGTLDVACDLTVVQGTIGTSGAPGDDAQLVVNTGGVDLTVGDGTNRTLTINDVLRFGQGAPDLRLILAAAAGPTRANLVLNDPLASLTFLGLNTSQVRIETSTQGVQGLITRSQANSSATITALHVSVLDNDANGVLGPTGALAPIQAQGVSIDRGNNLNWTFTAGGALRIVAATLLGDGAGSIDRVRLAYSLPIDPATVGDVFLRFTLRQLAANPADPPLQTITGTSASVLPSQDDNVLEVRFGSGVPRTDVTGLELRYAPPTSGQLSSDTGIPAAQPETISTTSAPALVDGAPPVVIGAFFQDLDLNGGLDRLNLFCSEPVAFSAARGTSVSGFQPVTSTTDLGGNTSLTLQIAGEGAVTINLTPGGIPRLTGEAMAQRIQDAVRALVATTPPLIAGHDPLKRPAYSNFTCQFSDGRYLLRAGVPLLFDAGSNTYRQDWASSTVQVVAGPADAAPQLRLGAANGGVEQAGQGDERTGLSVSGPVNPDTISIPAGTDANLRVDSEDFRAYDFSGLTTGLENVALVLEGLVRAADNEAQNPPNQVAYGEFVAVPDRARGRLVLVSGAAGPGSRVEVLSSGGDVFATTAALGSANAAAGASEPAGAANTLVSLDDLRVRGQDGSNLLLGATPGDLTIAGSVVVVNLSNVAGSGLGTPSFSLADDGDGGFLADRAAVRNVASGEAGNLPAGNPLILVGDADGDGALSFSPGAGLLDAAQSVFPLGSQGVSVTWSWDFVSGPGSITLGGLTAAAPQFNVANTPAFSFGATVSTTAGVPYVFRLTVTLLDQAGQPVVNAFTDANGQIVSLVSVNITEDPPVALAGPDQTVVAASLLLDATGSFDPNGGAITFQWSAVDGLGLPLLPGVFDDATLSTPRFTPGGSGTFTVTVTVRKVADPTLTASDSARLTLVDPGNFPPEADAGPDVGARVNTVVTLDGSGSRDPEGTMLTFAWSPVSLAAPGTLTDPAGARPTFTPQVPGAYVWRLTVTDASGQSDTDDVTITVQDDLATAPRLAPAAEPRAAGLRRSAFLAQQPATTAGVLPVLILERNVERQVTGVDLASDPNDDPAPGSTAGLLTVHAVVGNALFASYFAAPLPGDGDPVAIRFAPGQEAVPLVAYGVSGQSFVLDGTRSQDDGVIASFSWRQVSGPFLFDTRAGNLLAVVPPGAGTYEFELTVTDNVGLTSLPRRISVPVVPAGNPAVGPPAVVLDAPAGSVAAPGRVLLALTVTGSAGQGITVGAAGSSSRNAGAVTFRWVQLSGPLVTLSGADTATLNLQAKSPGPILLQVTITDQNGVSVSELVWVTVGLPGRPAPVARISEVGVQTLTPGTPLEVTLQGGSSSGDAPLQYRWGQTRGVPLVVDASDPGSGRLRITQAGTYEVTLQVVDANGVLSAPQSATFEVSSSGDAALASGGSFSKSSGGCALPARGAPRGRPAALLLGLLLVGLGVRRAGAGRRA